MEQPRNPALDMTDIASKIAPLLFGQKQTTDTSTSGSVDPTQLAGSNALIAMLTQQGTSTAQSDGIVADILHRAQLAFAPVLGEEKSAGMYNSQTRTMMAQEAVARATAASAQAVMENQQKALATAAQLQGTNVQSTRSQSSKSTENKGSQGKNILGTVAATVLAHKAIKGGSDVFDKAMAQLDNLRSGSGDQPEQLSGPTGTGDAAGVSAGTPIGSEEFLGLSDFNALDNSASFADTSSLQLAAADTSNPAADSIDTTVAGGSDAPPAVGDDSPPVDIPAGDSGGDAVNAADDFNLEDFSDFFADGGIVPVSREGYTEQANQARQNRRLPVNIVAGNLLTSSSSSTSLAARKRTQAIDETEKLSQAISGDSSAANPIGESVGPAPAGLGLGIGLANAALGLSMGPVGLAIGIANALAGNGVGAGISGSEGSDSLGSMTGDDSLGAPAGSDGNAIGGVGANAGDSTASGLAGNAATAGESGAPAGDSPGGSAPGGDSPGGDGVGGDGAGVGGDGGGSGDGGAEFDGGVQMANTVNESSGVDKKIIHVTPGESVLPVDTTEALQKFFGPTVIEDLIAATHTPLRKQAGRRR